MKPTKIKTHVLIVSRSFPLSHPKAQQETLFFQNIAAKQKIHTIRANYDLWKKRIEEVNRGEAVLSVRYWSAVPYHVDEFGIGQVEAFKFTKDDGIGVQKLEFFKNYLISPCVYGSNYMSATNVSKLAENDGLSLEDFEAWFKGYDLSTPKAIIHFTPFRY